MKTAIMKALAVAVEVDEAAVAVLAISGGCGLDLFLDVVEALVASAKVLVAALAT